MKKVLIILLSLFGFNLFADLVTTDGLITYDHIACTSACDQNNYHQYTIYNPRFKAADGNFYRLGYKSNQKFDFFALKEKICISFGLSDDSRVAPSFVSVGSGTELINDLFGDPIKLQKRWIGSDKGFVITSMNCEFHDPKLDPPIVIPPVIVVQ